MPSAARKEILGSPGPTSCRPHLGSQAPRSVSAFANKEQTAARAPCSQWLLVNFSVSCKGYLATKLASPPVLS